MDAATGPLSQAQAGRGGPPPGQRRAAHPLGPRVVPSFQTFRLRLVDLLDDLLARMEGDPSYARFLLDGQLAVVDDYLAVRPQRGRPAAAAGRQRRGWRSGPGTRCRTSSWSSGETLVRDLQMGLAVADRLRRGHGGRLPARHVRPRGADAPDPAPASASSTPSCGGACPRPSTAAAFWWRAPDGTTVRAEYLPDGYGNGSALPDDAKALRRPPSTGSTTRWGDLLAGPVLWMNGTDHQMPQPWLGRVVAEANALQDDSTCGSSSLAEHLATAPTEGLPTWAGELRSGARANLLMGVTSNRVDVRRAAARAERARSSAGRAAVRAVPAGRAVARARCWTRRGGPSCATPPTTRCAPARSTTWSTPCCTATARPPTSPRAWPSRALAARRRGPVGHAAPVVVNPRPGPGAAWSSCRCAGADAPGGHPAACRASPADVLVRRRARPALVVPAAEQVDWLRHGRRASRLDDGGRRGAGRRRAPGTAARW